MITAHGAIAAAVEAMKLGAVDFLQKPCSPVEIRELVAQFLARGASGNPGQLAGDVEVPSRRVEHRPKPTYKPAWVNLDRTTSARHVGPIDLGWTTPEVASQDANGKEE